MTDRIAVYVLDDRTLTTDPAQAHPLCQDPVGYAYDPTSKPIGSVVYFSDDNGGAIVADVPMAVVTVPK